MDSAASTPAVKAVLVGDASVGKTAIFKRLDDNSFDGCVSETVGGSYARLTVRDGTGVATDLGLWDTAGAERYRSIIPMYFHRSQIAILVFDLTSQQSFEHIGTEWIKLVRDRAPANVQLLLVGNKSDLECGRDVDFTSAQQLSEQIGAKDYIETSALSGAGIQHLKAQLGAILLTDLDDGDVIEPMVPEDATREGRTGVCLKGC
jgi:small GTP-binding protein